MNYELAKQLKDAGFPQKQYGNGLTPPEQHGCPHWGSKKHGKCDCYTHNPTLSELIEAFQSRYKYIPGLINDAQFVLCRTFVLGGKEGYIAYLDGDFESHEIAEKYVFISLHAEEAVAKLWLELNKK